MLFFLIWAVCIGIIPNPDHSNPAIWRFFAEAIPLIITIILNYIFVFFDKVDMKLSLKSDLGKNLLLSVVVAFIWIGLSLFVINLMGGISIDSKNKVNHLAIWFTSLFLNTMMQELMFRGYLYQMLKKVDIKLGVFISTALFTFLHGGALEAGLIPVLNVITMSLFMTVVLEYTDSLWPPIIIHYIWNAIGGLLFGTVSLAEDYMNMYNMNFHGSKIITGGAVKIEGSIVVLILNIILIIVFLKLIKKRKLIENIK
ncbi:MAG: type II CAAX endopeptidase family protein [Tissierellia bacterium]|nr:type II CAAX endopeptidase family protein [Tissierellia bacterium]